MRKTGIALLMAEYALFLYMSLAAPAYARLHTPLGATMRAAYAAPWPWAPRKALNSVPSPFGRLRAGEPRWRG